MPDFSCVCNSSASSCSHCSKSSSSYPKSVESKSQHEYEGWHYNWDRKVRYQRTRIGFNVLQRDKKRRVCGGVLDSECFLPFLVGAPKSVDCRMCGKVICSGEEVICSFRNCREAYHSLCAKESLGFSNLSSFKCPQHACFKCKQKGFWRCTRCTIASHSKCAPWQDKVIYLTDQPGQAVCWRHPMDWRLEKKLVDRADYFC